MIPADRLRRPLNSNVSHTLDYSMPIEDFADKCFVAFTDISGFKTMMKDGERAARAIDSLYNAGFDILGATANINGFFISDCGVLFARHREPIDQLNNLLTVVRALNKQVLADDIMLTTSIAWGDFSYHNRIEFPGIDKQPIFGNAYVSAFLDNETGRPRLKPGQCRILKRDIPESVLPSIAENPRIEDAKSHYYYYWMVEDSEGIQQFKHRYHDAYNLQFSGMLTALKEEGNG